jgi:enoyl-CoA hydratase
MIDSAKANALSPDAVHALTEQFDRARRDGAAALVLRGVGRAFSAGFDLSTLPLENDESLMARFVAIQEMLDCLCHAPYVTLAVVDGPAVGAGADLALGCMFRIGTGQARLRFPGAQFGIVLGFPRLRSILGDARALETLGGSWFDAERAHGYGLLTHLVDTGAEADHVVETVLSSLARVDPVARDVMLTAIRADAPTGNDLLRRSLRAGLHQRMTAFADAGRPASQ